MNCICNIHHFRKLTVGVGGRKGGRGQRGKIGITVNRITIIKNPLKNYVFFKKGQK